MWQRHTLSDISVVLPMLYYRITAGPELGISLVKCKGPVSKIFTIPLGGTCQRTLVSNYAHQVKAWE